MNEPKRSHVVRHGVACYADLSSSSTNAAYYENYDQLTRDDLEADIIEPIYVAEMDSLMASVVGDVSGKVVGDIGCGRGYLAKKLVANGAARLVAVDISMNYLVRLVGEPRIEPVLADAEDLPFFEEFDVVVSTDVLEHVLNMGAFIYCLNRSLRMGGRAFLRVPYRESLLPYSPQMGCKYRFTHLRTFNKVTLKDAFEVAGFRVKRMRITGFFFGRPRGFWTKSAYRMRIYESIRRWVGGFLGNEALVAARNPLLAGCLMKPNEIIVEMQKVKSI